MLESLWLKGVNVECLPLALGGLPRLQRLHMEFVPPPQDDEIEDEQQHQQEGHSDHSPLTTVSCDNLQALYLHGLPSRALTAHIMSLISHGCPKLQSIKLPNCQGTHT